MHRSLLRDRSSRRAAVSAVLILVLALTAVPAHRASAGPATRPHMFRAWPGSSWSRASTTALCAAPRSAQSDPGDARAAAPTIPAPAAVADAVFSLVTK